MPVRKARNGGSVAKHDQFKLSAFGKISSGVTGLLLTGVSQKEILEMTTLALKNGEWSYMPGTVTAGRPTIPIE